MGAMGVGVGVPEILILLWVAVPLAVGVWLLLTFHRMRVAHTRIADSLQRIEQHLERH
jgi:hypothetical protein